jgi:hypothetical protein
MSTVERGRPDPARDSTHGRPPLPALAPLLWWGALAALLTFVVAALVRPPGPLDDPDVAYQRDGLLLDGPVVDEEVVGVQFGDRPVVVLFERQPPDPQDLRQWLRNVPESADVRLVVPQPITGDYPLGVVADPLNRLAEAVDMPEPVDGGRPVGYAVVDAGRVVRYATLDPEYLMNGFEITTIVKGVR